MVNLLTSKMVSVLYLSLLLGGLFLISSGEGVVFCVKPSDGSSCLQQKDCLKCETLQYYFDNVEETINQYDNVTLVFTSGIHSACVGYNVIIAAAALKMTGSNQNVTVRDLCVCYDGQQYCGLRFSHNNSTLCVENIQFVNYTSIGNQFERGVNAKNVILKDCSFHSGNSLRGSIPAFKTLVAENCVFQNVYFVAASVTKCKNCTFSNSIFTLSTYSDTTILLFEDWHIFDSEIENIENCIVTIAGNSIISSRKENFEVDYSDITLSGNVTFVNNIDIYGGAVHAHSSALNITTGANVTFINNRALALGGAIFLSSAAIFVAPGANLTFVNNSAGNQGGAIYVYPGVTTSAVIDADIVLNCFLLSNNNNHSIGSVHFADNKAVKGGDDVYGASLLACSIINHHTNTVSAVSSDPLRVCLCENPVKPQCNGMETPELSYNYANLSLQIYPGEIFTVPIVLVGVDYGTTAGVVYSNIVRSESSIDVKLDSSPDNGRVISDHKQCTSLNYTLSTNRTSETNITMYMSLINFNTQLLSGNALKIGMSEGSFCIEYNETVYKLSSVCYGLAYMPIFLNITLLPCPSGFTLNANGHCDCFLHHVVFDQCAVLKGTGLFSWSTNAWASIYEEGILYDTHCPFDYCNITGQLLNLHNALDSQCAFNRAGRLCGGCRENYSLAIGSSNCIQCPNNNNLALVLFFAAAGFILVFFITALNLTVSQGMVNGLIFYANIVWTYKSIFFSPYQGGNSFFKVFIAWVNLDFGIETCFISGLTSFWKTWLQFVFPIYIWAIVGLIIVATKCSTKLTNLLNRAVHVLSTLFLLSYMKLLRLVVTALEFSYIKYTDQNSTSTHSVVWSVDGNLSYFGFPHILLLLAGLATLAVLCLPYTILLLLMQWLRRLPRSRLTNWIMQFNPVYDVYFAPHKHKHQYWFGVLLLARVILLMTFVSTFAIPQYVNLLILLVVGVLLIFYSSAAQPFKSTITLALHNAYIANLILLAGFVIVSLRLNQQTLQIVAVEVSSGVAFAQFCGIVLHNVIVIVKNWCQNAGCRKRDQDNIQEDMDDFIESCDRYPRGNVNVVINEQRPLLNSVHDSKATY